MRLFALLLSTLFLAQVVVSQPVLPEHPIQYDTDLLPASFHAGRRAALARSLSGDQVAVLFSAPARTRENDVDFEFRQSSDLYYLTGATEPGCVLILAPGGTEVDGRTVHEVLMVPPRNPMMESVVGRRLGVDGARELLGVEHVVSADRFEEILGAIADSGGVRFAHLPLPEGVAKGSDLDRQVRFFETVARPLRLEASGRLARMAGRFMMMVTADQFDRLKMFASSRLHPDDFEGVSREMFEALMASGTIDEWLNWRREHIDTQYADGLTLQAALSRLRMVKAPEEIAVMQRAIDVTAAAHREAMKSIEPSMQEYEIEALIEYIFKRNGAEYTGFPTIVGSGENSTVLHYESNRRTMTAGDVVVMDIGAEYHGYSADITRTVPVSGTFSPEQRKIYELVLQAQAAGIEATRAGNAFSAPDEAARGVISKGLLDLGLIASPDESRRFFMHGTSHYLGLYVHDVGDYGLLQPGTVITVEPGIYIPVAEDVDSKWWNIGVRIEDDVLVTESDPVVLSAAAPRSMSDIETVMAERGIGNEPGGLLPDPN